MSALSSGTSQAEAIYEYGAWGDLTAAVEGVPANRARFKGALWMGPELDLYYMRARWYGPKEGRFWSEDPLMPPGNRYSFGGNNPVTNADPTGLWCEETTIYTDDGAVEGLHCENIESGDWDAMRDYLGAPSDGDFFARLFGRGAGGVRWDKTTSNRILKNLLNGFAQYFSLDIIVHEGDAVYDPATRACIGHEGIYHCEKTAVDFHTMGHFGVGNKQVGHLLERFATTHRPDLFFGIAWYLPGKGKVTGWVHFDIRPKAHWRNGPGGW